MMENLHPDIISNIFSRLPVESVYQCKLVCKTWQSLLHNTKVGLLFSIGLHYRKFKGAVQLYYGGQYDEINNNSIDDDDDDDDDDEHNNDYYYSYKTLTKIDHPPITNRAFIHVMLGSCNGLVCFFVPHHGIDDPVYICNPITGEYVYLPKLTTRERQDSSCHDLVSGFGYNLSTDEYKVVRIYYEFDQPSFLGHVQVYTLGRGGSAWRSKGEITHFFCSSSIYANGALYWLDVGERKVVAFDLADEEFRLLPSPPCFGMCKSAFVGLRLLGGYVCIVYINEGKYLDIWALKKKKKKIKHSDYDVKEQEEYHSWSWSWSREFSIAWEGPVMGTSYQPFALTKKNEVLLLHNGILSCYDPKTATSKKLWDDDSASRYIQAIPHMNSNVSLKALGEKSVMRRSRGP
ncbi:F-box domain [Macleaya cordata]|uniref:F-box domain n=1 Tax=Macleaya cordata TaxID=56857 RepID=A0A200QAP6_MACCD|nr:F-box domain [Macleaya cordata]